MKKLVIISFTSFILFILLSFLVVAFNLEEFPVVSQGYGVFNTVLLAAFFFPGLYLNINLLKRAISSRDMKLLCLACIFIMGSWIYYWKIKE